MDPRVSLALRTRRGRPVPQAELASELRLPAAAVRQALDEMTRRGFAVEAHPMLGLGLVGVPPSLAAEEIAFGLDVRRIGRQVRCVERAASTNDLAWEAVSASPAEPAAAGAQAVPGADGLAIFAEYQSAGRGRRGSRWLSPPHESILCSVVAAPAPAADWAILTRAAAVAAAEAIEDEADLSVGIKWPNDVVVEDRKVAGILVEVRPAAARAVAVIGIGINCGQGLEAFPPDIRSAVGSLAMLGATVDRTLLARSLLQRLDQALARTERPETVEDLRREAARRCRTLGRVITVAEGEAAYTGEVIDLDPDYGLVLRLASGGYRRFAAMTTQVLPAGR